ncbi:DgyrCDS2439 [Dimorphilus gyrociliatus]|uniref:DgyrCDS2439 n=1 Tax=Dimorphilus gyrociliatus TaxID=2664684 RepID=A0A7I8VAN7_9ANNE|nr:DgyrCDS2439 [Dimorphilus gyrociliatus]
MSRKSTTTILRQLRELMKSSKFSLQAYIVPSEDAHMSEYIAERDARRAWISGFTGSAGLAVITQKEAALWTDGRYYLQANQQLDDNWTLMKDGLPDTPSLTTWLKKVLPKDSRIGVDPWLYSNSGWTKSFHDLNKANRQLVAVEENLIDKVWTDQPPVPCNPISILDMKFAGKNWQDKVAECRTKMEAEGATILVLSALDEIAYLLNLRGSDIVFNPVFFSYVIITVKNVYLFIDPAKVTNSVREHLKGVEIKPYGQIKADLLQLIEKEVEGKIWLSDSTNYAISSAVPEDRLFNSLTPINLMKANKNETEAEGMRRAHIKDSVALCQYFMWLEQQLSNNIKVDELHGSKILENFRAEQDEFVGPSFETISSSGSNGSIIHYKVTPETNRPITKDELYLCDSGAQFKDGTTDVTRTIHFGTPTEFERDCFTRVLKGHIALTKVVFPNGVMGSRLDSLARLYLWEGGLDYQHGTGHGVGCFLNVHEGPCRISYKLLASEVALQENMVLSNEPGYYEDGKFGIRIENLQIVVKADTKNNFGNRGYLTFEPITLVPIQKKMIIKEMLTPEEVDYVNSYHKKCREVVGGLMLKQSRNDLYKWLVSQTEEL